MDDILRHPSVRWIGALDLQDSGAGLRPSRLPADSAYQADIPMGFVGAACSGVRIAFSTDATDIRIAGSPLRFRNPHFTPLPARIDLVVDGDRTERREIYAGVMLMFETDDPADMEIVDDGPGTIEFAGLADRMKRVEIWLPHATQFTVTELAVNENARIETTPPVGPAWIHYGSSISHCIEADGPHDVWPAVAGRIAGMEVTNLGFAAQCHVDQMIARHLRDSDAAVFSLKLGINTLTSLTERTFAAAVHGFLDTLRDGHPTTPIVIVSPIFCPGAESDVGPMWVSDDGKFHAPHEASPNPIEGALTLESERTILHNLVAARVARGDQHLHYLHGHELFGPDDVDDLPDLLHPNGAGYMRMGERFAAKVFGDDGLLPRGSFAPGSGVPS